MIPKFRAWSKTEKIMSDVKKIDFNNGEIDARSFEETAIEEVELMSSTCLFDKKGTEIFEGDILHHQTQTEYTFIVKYDKEYSRWIGDGINCSYKIEISKDFMPYYEIIGNIYENPELLGV